MTALAALCFSLTAQAQGPVVVSDKDDYSPGETALFQATGFQPGELLDFSVAISNENGDWVPDIAWADVAADASGNAEVDYVVPNTWLNKTLQLTVMGLTSGLVATTTFTDAPIPTSCAINAIPASPVAAGTNVALFAFVTPDSGTIGDGDFRVEEGTDGVNFPNIVAHHSVPPRGVTGTFHTTGLCGQTIYFRAHYVPSGGSGFHESTSDTLAYTLNSCGGGNSAPTITCLTPTADLGQAYGCLGTGTGFGQTFSVSYSVVAAPSPAPANEKIVQATFTKAPPSSGTVTVDVAKVDDTDGDTITVTPSPTTDMVTISGPGSGSAIFSVNITANDGHNPDVTSPCGGTATAQIIYQFNGFFPPLSNTATTKVKQGSTVPVKFQVTDCSGNVISTSNDWISVAFQQGSVPSGTPTIDDAGASNDNGIYFRWDPTGMQDIFNLKTGGADVLVPYQVGDTYKITAHLDDGTTHDVSISIK